MKMQRFLLLLACMVVAYGGPLQKEKQTEKVVGGTDAKPNTWRWQVSLQYDTWNLKDYAHICGGTLVSPSYVMTAAHCILSLEPKRYIAVMGEYNLYKYEGSEMVRMVEKIVIHPDWTGDLANGNDIAMVKLASPVYDNGYIQMADLPYPDQILPHNYECYVTGWGLLATGAGAPAILQQAPINVVEHAICSTPEWWGSVAKATMVCAGGDGKTSGCQGDSGGPLNCYTDGAWRVHGVVSYGPAVNCNMVTKPTVFTRVSYFMEWIYNVISS